MVQRRVNAVDSAGRHAANINNVLVSATLSTVVDFEAGKILQWTAVCILTGRIPGDCDVRQLGVDERHVNETGEQAKDQSPHDPASISTSHTMERFSMFS